MRYHLLKVSLTFPYSTVAQNPPSEPDIPPDVLTADPAPPPEKDGKTWHVYLWSKSDPKWDYDGTIQGWRKTLELQGHILSNIQMAVVRTSGLPDQVQQTYDRDRWIRESGIWDPDPSIY